MVSIFLSDNANLQITLRELNNTENLVVAMNLLCSPYPSIQLDAFNVFKVFSYSCSHSKLFVANARSCASVRRIIEANRTKLLSFFSNFLANNGFFLCIA